MFKMLKKIAKGAGKVTLAFLLTFAAAGPAFTANAAGTSGNVGNVVGNTTVVNVTEESYFLFTANAQGYWNFATSDNGESDPYLKILDSRGRFFAGNDDAAFVDTGLNSNITVFLDEGEEIIINTTFYGYSSQNNAGSYKLTISMLNERPDYLDFAFDTEFGINVEEITADARRAARVTEDTFFSFTPDESGFFNVAVSNFRSSDENTHAAIMLMDSSGNSLGLWDSGENPNLSSYLRAGTFYVIYAGFISDDYLVEGNSGSFQLNLTKIPEEQESFRNTFDGDIVPLSASTGDDIMTVRVTGETMFSFTPEKAGIWTFQTSGNSGNADPFLTLFDSYGNVLFVDDDGAGGYNSLITTLLFDGAEYFINAGYFSDDTVGNYNLDVRFEGYLADFQTITAPPAR